MKPALAAPTPAQFEAAFRAYHQIGNAEANLQRLRGYSRMNDGMRASERASMELKRNAEVVLREFFAVAEAVTP